MIIPWTNKGERNQTCTDNFHAPEQNDNQIEFDGGLINRSLSGEEYHNQSLSKHQVFELENTPLSVQASPSSTASPTSITSDYNLTSRSDNSHLRIRIRFTDQYLWSHSDHFRVAMKIAPLWFLSNYFYNLSLAYTTITSSTVLASTGSVFTFIFSLICGNEKFTKWKALGVLMAVGGSIMTSLKDASTSNDGDDNDDKLNLQLWGDTAGLIAAIGYGGYTVLLKVFLPSDENRMSMQLFLGYIGLTNMISLLPFVLWTLEDMNGAGEGTNEGNDGGNSNYNGTQKLTLFILSCLVVKGLFDNVISDYLWARSIILTSPTVATVGVGLTIPLALLSDVFIMHRGDVLNFANIAGAVLVLVGFIFVNVDELVDESLVSDGCLSPALSRDLGDTTRSTGTVV